MMETNEHLPPKGKMKTAQAIRFLNKLRGRAAAFSNRCHAEQWSHGYMLRVWREVVCNGADWDRAPRWVHERMGGWYECFNEEIWRRHTAWHVWCGVQQKHVRTRTHGGSEEPLDWSKVDADKGASIWLASGKIYSGYDPTGKVDEYPTDGELELMRLTW